MKRALGIALVLLAVSTAQASSWQFTLTHLCRSQPGDADVCIDMRGNFGGTDANADGVLSLDELAYLDLEAMVFHPSWSNGLDSGSTGSFSYGPGGALTFSASATFYRVQVSVATGLGYEVYGPVPDSGLYAWTPESQALVTAVVPEPAPSALMLVGLVTLSALRRRVGINLPIAGPRSPGRHWAGCRRAAARPRRAAW